MGENQITFTRDQVYAASLEYFDGDTLQANVFTDKYALRDRDGAFYELTPADMHRRLAREFARIESKYQNRLSEDEIFDYFDGFRYIVPQGSVMFGAGNNFQTVSVSNCSVLPSPDDTLSDIMGTARDLASLYKRRFGAGVDISTLRPEGASVSNAAVTSTGAWSFADLYSYVTRMVGQNSRRGALMVTLDIRHPDIEKFIKMKADLTKVTGANVSVRVSDEFMTAVERGTDWELRWPIDSDTPKVTRTVPARDLFKLIAKYAHANGEPGLLLWDNICRNLPLDYYPGYKTSSTNPCCVTGDTEILTIQGPRKIADLAATDEDVWVYAVNKKTSDPVVRRMNPIVKTWENVPIVEVTFDSGLKVKCTPNHNFIDPYGNKVQAGDMAPGSRVAAYADAFLSAPANHVVVGVSPAGHADVYNATVDEVHTYIIPDPDSIHEKSEYTGIISANSELPLSEHDSCRLISIYLSNFVLDAFEEDARFDFQAFRKVVQVGMRLSDDLVDLELEKLEAILEKTDTDDERELFRKFWRTCYDGRRTGLGTHGLGDTLARLRIRYDSDEAVDMVHKIYSVLRDTAYETSVDMAEERGAFPIWDWETEKDCEFFERMPAELVERMSRAGRRNGSLLTCAPTGSVSILSDNCSSGIEPVFMNSYVRRRKVQDPAKATMTDASGDMWEEYTVYHPNVYRYMEKFGVTEDELPDFFVTSDEIDWRQRVRIQGAITEYLDHSVSSTVNLPSHVGPEVVEKIYMEGWKQGSKGITVYRDGSREAQVLSSTKKEEPEEVADSCCDGECQCEKRDVRPPLTHRGLVTTGTQRKAEFISSTGKKRKVYCFTGSNDAGEPVEVFVTDEKGGREVHAYATALGKLISLGLKYKVPPEDIVNTLMDIQGDSVSYDGGMYNSVPQLVAKELAAATVEYRKGPKPEYLTKNDGFSDNGTTVMASGMDGKPRVSVDMDECPMCEELAMPRAIAGCPTCQSCGYSKCG